MRGRRFGRAIGVTVAAALVAGVAGGAGARLLMRGVALAMGADGQMSLAGTLGIFLVFVVLAVPAAATATARPMIMRGGRWVTAGLEGWAAARTGLSDAQAVLLADEGRLPLLALLTVAFAALVVAYGRLAQHVMRRLMRGPDASTGPASASPAQAAVTTE
ncbi:hypothetical protein [Sphaerisporangium fuscum]|uniref:hypothetical protein n=1 Tax=Sphaerisporangium fuscum TaxID=2835868 RepID=UPI001BDD9970|nr:hypothetical protein [Sphaerisporangium fuscum]